MTKLYQTATHYRYHLLGRRSFCFGVAAVGSYVIQAGFLIPRLIGTAAAKESEKVPDKSVQDLESFMEVSRYFTENKTLSPEVGTKILKNLQSSLVHRKNLTKIYILLKEMSPTKVQSPTAFSVSHSTLQGTIQELLTAWYIGYLNTGKHPVLFTYYEALMYQAVAGVQNIPAICGGELNFWSKPPVV